MFSYVTLEAGRVVNMRYVIIYDHHSNVRPFPRCFISCCSCASDKVVNTSTLPLSTCNSVTLYLRLSDAEMMSCLMNELSLDVNSSSSSISRVDLCVLLSAARYRCLSVCAWCFVVLKATGSADIGHSVTLASAATPLHH